MAGYKRWEVWEDWGITKRQFNDYAERATADGAVLVNGEPIPGAKTALRRIHKLGHTVHIITARGFGPRARPLTCAWLVTHKIPHDTLTFAYDKRVMNVDLFLDDKPANVDAMREVDCAAYLYDTGRIDQVGHPYLISGWDEFLAIVEELPS
jgi:5'(3')-deoxyribonucleotidase